MSPSSLYERNKQGDGPTRIKVGGRVLYRPEDVDRWLVAHIEDAPTAS
jgi:predicted DNA-binding transcriptional regulator AlpA